MNQMIKCESCGARYNYAQDETCPKCGAYNSPHGGTHTCTVEELKRSSRTGRREHRATQRENPFEGLRVGEGENLWEQFARARHGRDRAGSANTHYDQASGSTSYHFSDDGASSRRSKKAKKERPLGKKILRIVFLIIFLTQILPAILFGLFSAIGDELIQREPISPEPDYSIAEAQPAFPWEGGPTDEDFENWSSDLSFNTVYNEVETFTVSYYDTMAAHLRGAQVYESPATKANLPEGMMCVLVDFTAWSEAPEGSVEPVILDMQLALDHEAYYGFADDETKYAFVDCLYLDDEDYAWLFEDLANSGSALPFGDPVERTLMDYDTMNEISGGDTIDGTAVFVLERMDPKEIRPCISFFASANDDFSVFDDIHYIQSPLD